MTEIPYETPESIRREVQARRIAEQQAADLRARRQRAEAVAAGALYVAVRRGAIAGREVTWVDKLGPLTRAERDRVRRFVSSIITYEVSSPGYSPAEKALLALK